MMFFIGLIASILSPLCAFVLGVTIGASDDYTTPRERREAAVFAWVFLCACVLCWLASVALLGAD